MQCSGCACHVLLLVLFSHQKSYSLRTVKKAQWGAWNQKRCVVLRHPQGSLHLQFSVWAWIYSNVYYIQVNIYEWRWWNYYDLTSLWQCQMFGLVWSRFKFIVLTGGGQTQHSSHHLLIHRENSHLLPICKWGTKLEHINPSLNYIKCHWCDLTLTYTHMEGS